MDRTSTQTDVVLSGHSSQARNPHTNHPVVVLPTHVPRPTGESSEHPVSPLVGSRVTRSFRGSPPRVVEPVA